MTSPSIPPHDFDYDVLIIGAGPGGYVAAIRASQLGLKTACVDKRKTLGGTCLNIGCIPSKFLLHASERFEEINSGHLGKFGISSPKSTIEIPTLMKEKNKVVQSLTKGIAHLFKKNKVTSLTGTVSFTAPHTVSIDGKKVTARDIIIATGSTPTTPPAIALDGKHIVDSTGALEFEEIPSHLAVIGGGVIGLELGSVWRRLGAKVSIIEYSDTILAGMDKDLSAGSLKAFQAQGIEFLLGQEVTKISNTKSGKKIDFTSRKDAATNSLTASHVLVATGRRPLTDNLGLDAINLDTDQSGFIKVNEQWQTAIPHVWAIGDVCPGLMLAHRAEDEGVGVAEIIAGQVGLVNHEVIPNVVYTHPEIASVGLTETEARAKTDIIVGQFPFAANSRAKANGDHQGFVKIIADAKYETVLGIHILGAEAGTMIAQGAQAMELGASIDDIAYTCHAHPTRSEALKEAALAARGKALHI